MTARSPNRKNLRRIHRRLRTSSENSIRFLHLMEEYIRKYFWRYFSDRRGKLCGRTVPEVLWKTQKYRYRLRWREEATVTMTNSPKTNKFALINFEQNLSELYRMCKDIQEFPIMIWETKRAREAVIELTRCAEKIVQHSTSTVSKLCFPCMVSTCVSSCISTKSDSILHSDSNRWS